MAHGSGAGREWSASGDDDKIDGRGLVRVRVRGGSGRGVFDPGRFTARPDRFPAGFPRTGGDKRLIDLIGEGLAAGDICARFHSSDFEILSRLRAMVEEHLRRTDSPVADRVLAEWDQLLARGAFVKVMPHDYKRVLRELAEAEELAARAAGNGDLSAPRPLDAVGEPGA